MMSFAVIDVLQALCSNAVECH